MNARATLGIGFLGLLFLATTAYSTFLLSEQIYLIYDTYAHTEDLRLIDESAYNLCQKIADNPQVTEGPVYFRVDRGSSMIEDLNVTKFPYEALAVTPVGLYFYSKTVILTKQVLNGKYRRYLDVIVAHELGHIQLRHTQSDQKTEEEADRFAAELVGSYRVLEFKMYGGLSLE
ncbi:MAG: hypothetical protein A2651_00790 [Candidatus Yanofskybacteria bacterium RIFCSPHIGHO2_01_FULL_42_12]|uniref:Uncharacterized protein n=1 Tax=Candidatus Yanofskybacteria bacterium RIFCSPLOWO2_01_FULL_42_49 TaxID=1802694 RepID=A0A1F8GCC8_9BACT|nr:MAG: hypothetical protein A2651_00790 [Candidatus Yanofskybacteria bacterium RIFCSPHIGHO2_01_FULL_42_12]OGN23032.1 MAG: hypothetical protein A2918_02790 [Candidatus Yanofskybacteria bacterium RIFCSPLOWO2_01_FULL_42_49]